MFNRLLAWMILPFLSCLPGCFWQYADISNDPRYPTDYVVGGVYRLKQPVYVSKADLTIFGTYSYFIFYATQPNEGIGLVRTLANYEREPAAYPDFAGIAPAGSHIKVLRIVLMRNPETGPNIWVHGVFVDVPWATKEGEMAFISRRTPCEAWPEVDLPHVHPDILEFVHGHDESPAR